MTVQQDNKPEEKPAYENRSKEVTKLRSDQMLTLEQRVERRTRELTTLLQISRDVTSNLSLDSLLDQIIEKLKGVVDYTSATIVKLDGDEFQQIARSSNFALGQAQTIRFPASNRIDAKVITSKTPLIIDDVLGESEDAVEFRRQAGEYMSSSYKNTRNWMRVPLVFKDEVIGMLTLHYHEPNTYTNRHAGLAMAFAEHAAVAIENARLYEQARQFAALEERQKLARELHDSVSQALYGIALGARTARTLLERDPAQAVEPIEYVMSLAEAGLAEMRALIFELRPESLQTEGLLAALSKQIDSVRARHQIHVDVDFCDEPEVPLKVKETLYRVTQEALNNIIKHARAASISVRLTQGESGLQLTISDDGVGFQPEQDFPGHLGLKSMRERVENIGGRFTIESAPGSGSRIEALIPAG